MFSSLSPLAYGTWGIVPLRCMESAFLQGFKTKAKQWIVQKCSFPLCKISSWGIRFLLIHLVFQFMLNYEIMSFVWIALLPDVQLFFSFLSWCSSRHCLDKYQSSSYTNWCKYVKTLFVLLHILQNIYFFVCVYDK